MHLNNMCNVGNILMESERYCEFYFSRYEELSMTKFELN